MEFIDRISQYAIVHGLKNNILPSLIIAQGILESASGTSELAVNANNLFGIKEGSGWNGEIFAKESSEHNLNGDVFYITSKFRKYPTYEGSVIDLVHKYTNGTGWEQFNRYQAVVGEKDYRKATEAIYKAGYATDVNYPNKLNSVIEKYNLLKYDRNDEIMVKVALDAGHGISTPGKRTPDNEREWSFNNKVLLAVVKELGRYENVQILRTDDPTGKTDVPLKTRTNKANNWKADVLVSIHHNALAGKWHGSGGVETFVYTTASKASNDIANTIQPLIVKAMGLSNRGVKKGNLHMIRESNMPAILTEGGFMDSTVDIKALRSDEKLKAQGVAIANGLAKYFKLKLKSGAAATPPTTNKKEGSDNMSNTTYKPTSKAVKDSTINVLAEFEKLGFDGKWKIEAEKDALELSNAIGLIFVAINKGLIELKR